MRASLVGLLAAVVFCGVVSSAGAAKPIREFFPTEDNVIEGVCAFDVEVEVLENRAHTITFADGRQILTGTLKVRLTNLSEPSKTITANISGPGTLTPSHEGFTIDAHGRWLFFFLPGDLGEGHPGMIRLVTGKAQLTFGPTGLAFEQKGGTSTDVCEALA